jgi:hypothetical protein
MTNRLWRALCFGAASLTAVHCVAATDNGEPILPIGENDSSTTDTGRDTATGFDAGRADATSSDSAADSTTAANVTGGSGGVTGPADQKSQGNLSFKINAPAGNAPRGLLILLHGSTASNYAQFVGMMQTVATQYGLIPVSVLAPNGQGWNEGNQAQAATLLNRLIQEDLYPKYNIDKSKVVFSGQSSGGGFLSTHFVPTFAKDYQGGAFFQCGAAPPAVPFAPDAATRQKFRLHFEITTGDNIWPTFYAQAVQKYTDAQMQLTKDNTKTGGHCQFDQQKVIQDHLKFVLNLP